MPCFDLMSASVEDELVFLIFQTSQLIFRFYYGSWRAPTSLHCWLAGVNFTVHPEEKCAAHNSLLFAYDFFWGGMTEFWHFSYPFNVRNDPSEFENKRTNTSSVILCQLRSLPFFSESVRGRAAECLSFYKVLVLKKKKIWLLTEVWVFFNAWVTVRSTVQNSLSASLSAGNCQWQKQNYEYFFFFLLYGFQNLTTDKLHSFSLQSSRQRTVSVF